jgi:Fe-Mn family superoxide dismutase
MYEAKDFSSLKIEGISNDLINNHLELYKAYVKNTNHLLEHLEKEEDEVRFAELKRRFGWEWNGMRLHEYFFSNIGEPKILSEGPLKAKITADFGSFENWLADFKRISLMRGIGWAALYFDKSANRLLNVWIDEHDKGHLAGERLILIIDFFEHAFMVDKLIRPEYVEIILGSINWREAEKRFE